MKSGMMIYGPQTILKSSPETREAFNRGVRRVMLKHRAYLMTDESKLLAALEAGEDAMRKIRWTGR